MLKSNIIMSIKKKTGFAEANKIDGYLFTGYSQKKLQCLSETYEELAKIYRSIPQEQLISDNRRDILYTKQLQETKNVFANHLDEISGAFAEVADTVMHVSLPVEHKRRSLIHYLKKRGVIVRELIFLEGENTSGAKNRISIEARVSGRYTLPVDELCMMISEFFGRNLIPALESTMMLNRCYATFIFEDAPQYSVMSAVARATKENEKISGDNFSLEEYNQNQVVMMISDGMGSGEQACRDSQAVVELMEKFFEAGFNKERAFAMANGAFASQTHGCNLTTLDLCAINLLTGEAEFMKAGAAPSYLKRCGKTDEIVSDTLPLGGMEDIYPLTRFIKLKSGDMIIMVSDGVTDAFDNTDKNMTELITSYNTANPKEMSDYLMQNAIKAQKGHISDDMTILVVSIWES